MLAPSPTPRPTRIDELVGPAVLRKLDRLDVLSRKVFAGKLPGERRSKRRGQSVEFDDYRQYVPGDDLRHIDWNVFARLDRFFVKLFREDEDLAVHLVVDASPSMDAGAPSKLVLAQRIALALGYIGLVNQNRVAAAIIGAPGRPLVQRLAPIRGRRNLDRLARFLLERVRPDADGAGTIGGAPDAADSGAFTRAIRAIANARTGRGVLVLLSDFLVRDDVRHALNYLAAGGGGGFDTTCLHILAPAELDPAIEPALAGDVRLIDAETSGYADVTLAADTIRRYRQRLDELLERLRSACAARGLGHVLIRSDADAASLLLDALRRRRLVG